jgi:hypothetical protein
MNPEPLKEIKPSATVLFSGGADSSVAAIFAIKNHSVITLLTFKNNYELFINRCCRMAERLKVKYRFKSINHKIINNSKIFKLILKNVFRDNGYQRNLKYMLLVQRAAMYIQTVIYCLENEIKFIYDGSNYKQGRFAFPQREEIVVIVKDFFKSYGLLYQCPIYYNSELSEEQLIKEGLITPGELYQTERLILNEDRWLPLDIILGLKNKFTNRLHPIFFIETILQFLGRIGNAKYCSEDEWQSIIQDSKSCMNDIYKFGNNYIESYLSKS